MDKKKQYIQITLIILISFFFDLRASAQQYRTEVALIVQKMDSILVSDSLKDKGFWLESRNVGYGSSKSEKYNLYKKLLETANTNELFKILADSTLKPPIRAYSYMAYAYHIDSLNIPEQPTDFDFKVNVQIGCVGTTQKFQDFKTKARVRGLNNPYPRKFQISPEESEVIKMENKIREEQGESQREK